MNSNQQSHVTLIKDAVMSFRVKELHECLSFLKMPKHKNERKFQLQERIINFMHERFFRNAPENIPPQLLTKIFTMERMLRRNSCRRGRKPEVGLDSIEENWETPFFETVAVLQECQHIYSSERIGLNIPNYLMKLFRGRRSKKFTYEVQMLFSVTEHVSWSSTVVQLKVNNDAMEFSLNYPVYYITKSCCFKNGAKNDITINFQSSTNTQDYMVKISIVKRITPRQLVLKNPPKEVSKALEILKKRIKSPGPFVYQIYLTSYITGKLIKNPCRSNLCDHPDVFDLDDFLEYAQYQKIWHCPLCKKKITYKTLELENYYKTFVMRGKLSITFHKERNVNLFQNIGDKSVIEIINID